MKRRPHRFFSGLESLESRAMFSVTALDTEPNNTMSTAVAFEPAADRQVELVGTSTSDNDKDFFSFVAPESGTWTAKVQSPNGNYAQFQAEIQGVLEVETEPNDNIHTVSFSVQAGEKVYLRLRSPNNDAAQYQVLLTGSTNSNPGGGTGNNDPAPSVVADQEPNGSEATAQRFGLSADGTAQLTGVSTNSTDIDYFRVVPQQSGHLNVRLHAPQGNAAKVTVDIEDSTLEVETEPNDGVNLTSIPVEAGQTVYVRVESTNSQSSSYVVHVELREQPGDPSLYAGDLDQDGDVDRADYQLFHDHFNADDQGFDGADINNDNLVNETDYVIICNNMGRGTPEGPINKFTLDPTQFKSKFKPPQYYEPAPGLPHSGKYGDTDGDWDVDSNDLLEIVSKWTGAKADVVDATFQITDIDGDGDIDSIDLMNLISNWTGSN